MSAPGIQLNSDLSPRYFRPDLREYLQGVEKAVVSANLEGARQAFAHLSKVVETALSGGTHSGNEHAAKVQQGVDSVAAALQSGDLGEAGRAISQLRQRLPVPSADTHETRDVETAVPESAVEDGSTAGTKINVRA